MPNESRPTTTGRSSKGVPLRPILQGAAIALVLGAVAPEGLAGNDRHQRAQIPFSETRLIIEFNSSDEDVGVQAFLDGEGWRTVKIFNPKGREIFQATASGRLLRQGGGTELFLESEEPPLTELPFEEFFALFPEGTYRFVGRTAGGDKLVGSAEFTHNVPAGPEIVMPEQPDADDCANAKPVPIPVVIGWNEVTTSFEGEPLEVVAYQIIVDTFQVTLPAEAGTMVTVPPEFLEEGTEYGFEILAIEEGGNQTITQGCFVTAD